ncbi:MAG: long-chain fatty acid--CoA ligase [Terriglobales bacterium]
MKASMMDYPLTLLPMLERAGKLFPQVEIVSRLPDRSLHRCTYADFHRRARRLAEALQKAGLKPGERVATLMWNHFIHLECYFGIPAAGGVAHTLNLRLHPSELAYIVNHAEDRFLIVDDVLLPLFESFRDQVKLERMLVAPMGAKPITAPYENYEDFIASASGDFSYPALDENDAAAMCYTSGTTGKPKGVVYSHRALALHSFAFALPDAMAISQQDSILVAQPMFHANAWGVPFSAILCGSKLVFPGPYLDAESLIELLQKERVTFTAGVPTVWLRVLEALDANPGRWQPPPGVRIIVAGSAAPESMLRRFDQMGVCMIHFWGMTEITPAGTVSKLKKHMLEWPEEKQYEARLKQGMALPFVDVRVMAGDAEAPWDGGTLGELQVRGPWVAANYFRLPEESDKWTADGWFRTGDVVSIDSEGYVRIADRSKDLIKSGGEWISSVDLENALVGHSAVAEAAVIAVPHPTWQERPLAAVVLRNGATVTAEELRDFLAARFAKWQLPEAIVFVHELPHTSTGKLLKSRLREQYRGWEWKRPAEPGR